ncbi:MAG: hypothetical protein VKK04_05800 [Synechococcales bacterium]|nr:hypothetical protein [Synechococcales bacterium]
MLEFLFAVSLAWVNIAANDLEQWTLIPQSQWLPFANGVSLAYVFLEILPELGSGQRRLEYDAWPVISYSDWQVYLPMLLSVTIFYGMEALALRSPKSPTSKGLAPSKNNVGERGSLLSPIFWLHILLFTLYNGILGYLLQAVSVSQGFLDCLLFWVVLALHLLLNDAGLSNHYQTAYHQWGRWMVALAVVVGTLVGNAVGEFALGELSAPTVLWAFAAGGILFSGLTATVHYGNHSFWAFLTGVAIYTTLLLLVATP